MTTPDDREPMLQDLYPRAKVAPISERLNDLLTKEHRFRRIALMQEPLLSAYGFRDLEADLQRPFETLRLETPVLCEIFDHVS